MDYFILVNKVKLSDIIYSSFTSKWFIGLFVLVSVLLVLIFLLYGHIIRKQFSLVAGILLYLQSGKLSSLNNTKSIISMIYNAFVDVIDHYVDKLKLDKDIMRSKDVINGYIELDGVGTNFAYKILPALNFGGDFVKVFTLDDGCRIFFIADVSGKGFGASFLVGFLNSFFLTVDTDIRTVRSFEEVIIKFNQLFCKNNKRYNFICFKAIYVDKTSSSIGVINAGFPDLIAQYYTGKLQIIKTLNNYIPFGIEETTYSFEYIEISQYVKLYAISDGILEQLSDNGECFMGILLSELTNAVNIKGCEQVRLIIELFNTFVGKSEEQHDDVSVLILSLRDFY